MQRLQAWASHWGMQTQAPIKSHGSQGGSGPEIAKNKWGLDIEHFNVSRAISHEGNSSNQFNAVNIHDCLNDVCVSSNNNCLNDVCVSSNKTNLDSNSYSCRFSNSKLTKLNLSTSQVHQSNSDSRASPQKAWNLYSEYTGQEMSQKKSALWSHSAMKTKPDKYRFPVSNPPALQGLLEYTPKQLYLYISNLIYHRLTAENYNLWCELMGRDVSFPEMSKNGILETSYSLKNQRQQM